MPTIVGILTFISRINYRLRSSKPSIYLGYFSIYEDLNFKLSRVEHDKKFYNLGTGLTVAAYSPFLGRYPIADFSAMVSSPSHRRMIQSRTRMFSQYPGHKNLPFSSRRNQFTWKIFGSYKYTCKCETS